MNVESGFKPIKISFYAIFFICLQKPWCWGWEREKQTLGLRGVFPECQGCESSHNHLLPSRSGRLRYFFSVIGTLPRLKLNLSACVWLREWLIDRNVRVAEDRTSCRVSSNTCLLFKSSVQWWNKQTCSRLALCSTLSWPRPPGRYSGSVCKNVRRPPKFPARVEAMGLRRMVVGGTLATLAVCVKCVCLCVCVWWSNPNSVHIPPALYFWLPPWVPLTVTGNISLFISVFVCSFSIRQGGRL